MRNIINISVPASLKEEIEYETQVGGYASVSEFFRAVMREWKQDTLLRELKQSRLEISAGKGKVLRSFKALR